MTPREDKIEQNLNDFLVLLGIVQDCDHCREKFKDLKS